MPRFAYVLGFLLLVGCYKPPRGIEPHLPPGAATGTVLVYREPTLWNLAPALFGKRNRQYLGLKAKEYGEIEIAAGRHRFEAWAYYGFREEWRPHATLTLQIDANTRTCIKAHAKGPLLIDVGFVGTLLGSLIRPFRSAYEMAVVPCTQEGPPPGYKKVTPKKRVPATASGREAATAPVN